MSAMIEFYRRNPVDTIPAEEREGIWHVFDLLSSLETRVKAFQSAVDLMDYAQSKQSAAERNARAAKGSTVRERHLEAMKLHKQIQGYWQWQLIAARDAAVTIYHFGVNLTALRCQVGRYSALRGFFNAEKLKKAQKDFSGAYPKAERIRHAISHSSESVTSVEEMNKHRIGPAYVSSCLSRDRVFWMTFRARNAPASEVLSIRVDITTIDQLRKIIETATSAFQEGPDPA